MILDYLICMEMYGNGAGIGIGFIQAERKQTHKDPLPALTAQREAAVGVTPGRIFVQLFAVLITLIQGLTILVFVLSAAA